MAVGISNGHDKVQARQVRPVQRSPFQDQLHCVRAWQGRRGLFRRRAGLQHILQVEAVLGLLLCCGCLVRLLCTTSNVTFWRLKITLIPGRRNRIAAGGVRKAEAYESEEEAAQQQERPCGCSPVHPQDAVERGAPTLVMKGASAWWAPTGHSPAHMAPHQACRAQAGRYFRTGWCPHIVWGALSRFR